MVSCDECGFAGRSARAELVCDAGRFGDLYRGRLTVFRPTDDVPGVLRRRPAPHVWSALEYAAHVRDVFGFYDERIRRVVEDDRPRLTAFGFAAVCEERRYNDQDPAEVLEDLVTAAGQLHGRLDALPDAAWAPGG